MSKSVDFERPLPHLPDVERVILGAILAGHRTRQLLLDQMRPEDFFQNPNAAVARSIERLHSDHRPCLCARAVERLRPTVREKHIPTIPFYRTCIVFIAVGASPGMPR
jgi:replicative DNA helicase